MSFVPKTTPVKSTSEMTALMRNVKMWKIIYTPSLIKFQSNYPQIVNLGHSGFIVWQLPELN